jgi:hypothetical protein
LVLHPLDTERVAAAPSPCSNVSTLLGDPVRTAFEVSVPIAEGTLGERTLKASIAVWIFPPHPVRAEGAVALWYLGIPGATYRGLSYFDRQVSGSAPEEFSIARSLAKQGIGLVVIDPPGTGESETEVDGELMTSRLTTEVHAQVLYQLRERLTMFLSREKWFSLNFGDC